MLDVSDLAVVIPGQSVSGGQQKQVYGFAVGGRKFNQSN